jgi:hypothetical protein
MKVIRCRSSIVFSFRFMTISKYGNQVPVMNQWDRLTDFVGICVLSPCAVSMVWWRWAQCVAARWPDTLECHHSWQKCFGTTATAVMRIRIHAIDCGDLYRLHRALVHILYQKMARQGFLVVGHTEVWQGMMLLNDTELSPKSCLCGHQDIWFQSSQLRVCNCFHLCLLFGRGTKILHTEIC